MTESRPLPRSVRTRLRIGAVSAGLLLVMMVALVIGAVANGKTGPSDVAGFALLLGIPVVLLLLLWWQAHRLRTNDVLRRRLPNPKASKVMLWGNLSGLVVANLVRGVISGWEGLVAGLVLVVVWAFVVTRIARRHDPRVHFLRRPDPAPEGEDPADEPEPERAKPW